MTNNLQTNGFIRDYSLIKESCDTDDLLDFADNKKSLLNLLGLINKPSLVGLVGKFGIGKSTMLNEIKKSNDALFGLKKPNQIWIEFDAWKYPDRNDLWEGFVIDFAAQIGKKEGVEMIKKIDGKNPSIDIVSTIAGGLLSGSDKLLKSIFNSSPIKRVFQMQGLLDNLIKKQQKDIFIVIEDIDRSGDRGIYFLETLKQFLRNLETKDRVIAIAPIGDASFYDHQDSYHKCLDYIEFFNPANLHFYKFIKDVFKDDILNNTNNPQRNPMLHMTDRELQMGQMENFLKDLFLKPITTPRLLKTILRKADFNYQNQKRDGHNPDWRLSILFEATKYFRTDDRTGKNNSYFDVIVRQRNIDKPLGVSTYSTNIFYKFLECIAHDSVAFEGKIECVFSLTGYKSNNNQSRIKVDKAINGGKEKEMCEIGSFYLNY